MSGPRDQERGREAGSRRDFLKKSAAAGAGLGVMSAASYARAIGANGRIRVGIIGVGNRGEQLLQSILRESPGTEVVAAADVYEPHLAKAMRSLEAGAKAHRDYRALLEDKDIDAVVIASPDHWHAIHFNDACRAGKDVYVEKPLSLTVEEGRVMARVAQETGRVTQMGAQRHSTPYIREACRLMREGAIGKITRVRCFHVVNEFPNGIGNHKRGKIPAGLDWDAWLGPAPEIEFDELVWNYKFRWFWNYSGGQLTNFGAHWIDVIHMALGSETPRAVVALGGKYAVEDDREVPDTMEVIWEYPQCLVTFSQINANSAPGSLPGVEIEFRGTKGTLYLYGNRYEIAPQKIQASDYPARGPLTRSARIRYEEVIEAAKVEGRSRTEDHLNNFFQCVKSREKCNLDAATGHRSTVPTLIANIAYRTGRRLDWDSARERFIADRKANKMLGYKYRAPWKLEG